MGKTRTTKEILINTNHGRRLQGIEELTGLNDMWNKFKLI